MFVFHSYSEWCWERGWFLLVTTCERVEDKRVRDDDQKWICRSWMWKKEEWTNGALIEYERRSREFGKLRVENGTDGQMSDRCSQPCHPIDANFQATYWCQRLNDLSTFRPPRSNITLAIPRHNDFENNIIHSCSEEKRHWESHSHAFLSPYPADCRCSPHAKSQDDGQNLALYLLQLFEKWLTDILPAPPNQPMSAFYLLSKEQLLLDFFLLLLPPCPAHWQQFQIPFFMHQFLLIFVNHQAQPFLLACVFRHSNNEMM